MSSKKKKKNNQRGNSADAKTAREQITEKVSDENAVDTTDAAPDDAVTDRSPGAEAADNTENVPVQSLTEMLAFAHKTEAADALNAIKQKTDRNDEERPQPRKPKGYKESDEPEIKLPEVGELPIEKAMAKNDDKQSEPVDEPVSEPAAEPEKPAPAGPPVSEEEKARQEAAEDALDRDLQAARRKKLQEEAYLKKKRESDILKEAERIQKAHEIQQRHDNAVAAAAENAIKQEKARKARENTYDPSANRGGANSATLTGGAVSHGTNAVRQGRAAKQFNSMLSSMAAMRTGMIIVLILAVLYIAAFAHVKGINEKVYDALNDRLTSQSKVVSDSSIEYAIPDGATELSYTDKKNKNLSVGLPDSDHDGLSDEYELYVSDTDPTNPDSDGDSVYDGPEVRAGLDPLDPMTDGKTPDSEVLRDTVVGDVQVTAKLTSFPKTAFASISKVDNNSIQGTPGMVGFAYELYTDKPYEDCELVFRYSDDDLINGKNRIAENTLSVFKFNDEALAFEKVASSFNPNSKTVTAHVTENGIYAVCSSEILVKKGKTNVFFLIDNSGSMYPEELCANSEENDVEFKRLDFAMNLIDMIGVDACYGAGEFSGGYANIVPISDDYENVKAKINDIRNKNQVFSGTEIAGAISHAVEEFGADNGFDRNYIILLTDGMPSVRDEARDRAAIKAAKDSNITIFTIGLGKYIDADYLNNIAAETYGQFIQASNADALENIYEKIQNFMSYNQITIEEGSDQKGYIIADSGFNVLKDGVSFSNFRSDFAPNGADVGIAGLIRAYFRGELSPQSKAYTTNDGKEIGGYDISGIEGINDGKKDLKDVSFTAFSEYNRYLEISDKWDYRSIEGGVLHYNEETRDLIDKAGMKVITSPFKFEMPDETAFEKFLRTITFSQIKPFTEYECVILDSQSCEGADASFMDMIKWFQNIPYAYDKCSIYDFGYNGDEAFSVLYEELSTGSPAVITYGGSAMNAVRLTRDVHDPNLYILDAYDCNNPDRSTKLTIRKTPIYDDGGIRYQYSASRNSVGEPFRIIVMDDNTK